MTTNEYAEHLREILRGMGRKERLKELGKEMSKALKELEEAGVSFLESEDGITVSVFLMKDGEEEDITEYLEKPPYVDRRIPFDMFPPVFDSALLELSRKTAKENFHKIHPGLIPTGPKLDALTYTIYQALEAWNDLVILRVQEAVQGKWLQ